MNKFTEKELSLIRKLNTPSKIQDFLNSLPFNFEEQGETLRSPLYVLRAHKSHCIEGALLAAYILSEHGQEPLLLDLVSTKYDYDHVITLFKQHGRWGAISKTNHAVLRYREPVYKTISELALSYFHEYFLNDGTKTLRTFSKPFSLKKFNKNNWQTDENDLWYIGNELDASPHTPIVPPQLLRNLRKADKIEIEAGKLTDYKRLPNKKRGI